MFNAYIKITAGMTKWLLLIILEFFGPVIRWVFGLLSVMGLILFLGSLITQSSHPYAKTAMYGGLVCGLAGTFLLVIYEITMDKMLIDRILDTEDDEETTLWEMLRNAVFLLLLYAGISFGAYKYFHLRDIEAMVIGFALFIGFGITLGACRWIYRHGASVSYIASSSILKFKDAAAEKMAKLQLRKKEDEKSSNENTVVVPFRRRN